MYARVRNNMWSADKKLANPCFFFSFLLALNLQECTFVFMILEKGISARVLIFGILFGANK